MTYSEWVANTFKEYNKVGHNQRLGQFFFNSCFFWKPGIANFLRGTQDDCFYDDSKMLDFCAMVCYYWDKEAVLQG